MTVIRDTVKNDAGQNVDILIEVDEKALHEDDVIIRGNYDYGESRGPLDHAPEVFKKAFGYRPDLRRTNGRCGPEDSKTEASE